MHRVYLAAVDTRVFHVFPYPLRVYQRIHVPLTPASGNSPVPCTGRVATGISRGYPTGYGESANLLIALWRSFRPTRAATYRDRLLEGRDSRIWLCTVSSAVYIFPLQGYKCYRL